MAPGLCSACAPGTARWSIPTVARSTRCLLRPVMLLASSSDQEYWPVPQISARSTEPGLPVPGSVYDHWLPARVRSPRAGCEFYDRLPAQRGRNLRLCRTHLALRSHYDYLAHSARLAPTEFHLPGPCFARRDR